MVSVTWVYLQEAWIRGQKISAYNFLASVNLVSGMWDAQVHFYWIFKISRESPYIDFVYLWPSEVKVKLSRYLKNPELNCECLEQVHNNEIAVHFSFKTEAQVSFCCIGVKIFSFLASISEFWISNISNIRSKDNIYETYTNIFTWKISFTLLLVLFIHSETKIYVIKVGGVALCE